MVTFADLPLPVRALTGSVGLAYRAAGRFPIVNQGRTARRLLAAARRLDAPETGEGAREILGQRITCDLGRDDERFLFLFGDSVARQVARSPLGRVLAALAHDRPRFFLDVGANFGQYSLLARRLGFRTLAVEPHPDIRGFLERNLGAGAVRAAAASDHAGSVIFYPSQVSLGGGSLVPAGPGDKPGFAVRTETLDTLADGAMPDGAALFVKIDVERHEAAAVRGMGGLTARHRPVVWCEVRRTDRQGGTPTVVAVHGLFAGREYDAFFYDGRRIEPFDPAQPPRPALFDLLFVPRERGLGDFPAPPWAG
jgi:FkbM family methyltransferase